MRGQALRIQHCQQPTAGLHRVHTGQPCELMECPYRGAAPSVSNIDRSQQQSELTLAILTTSRRD